MADAGSGQPYEAYNHNERLRNLVRWSDGRVRAVSVLDAVGSCRSFSDWLRLNQTQTLVRRMGIEHAVKRQDKPGEVKGLYIHPSLIDPLAIWASSDYAAYFFNRYYVSNSVSPADSKRSSEEDSRENLPVVKEDVGEDSGDDRSRNDERYPETEPHPSAPQKDWSKFYHYALVVTKREGGRSSCGLSEGMTRHSRISRGFWTQTTFSSMSADCPLL